MNKWVVALSIVLLISWISAWNTIEYYQYKLEKLEQTCTKN